MPDAGEPGREDGDTMKDIEAERQRILASPPAALVAQAAANPGGSVAVIDPEYVDDPDGFVPSEAVHGCWLVGPDGKLTGEYRENPRHGRPTDDLHHLTDPDHWLGWLGDDPAGAVRGSLARCLTQQVPGSEVEWVKTTGKPGFRTGGRRSPEDEQRIVVTRAGLAVPFALAVTAPGRRREILTGVFSWVAVRLDRPGQRKDQVWLDLRADLAWAEEELDRRIYQVGESAPES
ncbi:hypothetical protein [Kitasatospora cineracea]|nr:hypothetical protein [Kitasatospora cineracea]